MIGSPGVGEAVVWMGRSTIFRMVIRYTGKTVNMHDSTQISSPLTRNPFRIITGIFSGIVAVAVALALLILILPQQAFLAISNYLQIVTAIGGALVLLLLYYRTARPEYLLYASAALGLWGIATIARDVNVLLGGRAEVFPGLIDMGMIAAILILGVAVQMSFPRRQVQPLALFGILALLLVTPVIIILLQGITSATLITLLFFFGCASLIVTGLNHSLRDYPLIFTGVLLFAIAFMAYPIRERFFPTNSFLNIIGTLVIAGFALIVIGYIRSADKSGSE
ncbi:MAG: hypothetical protein METHP_00352 [Methanoregula sp. SKADARSKE-2]|nr:MAG: hypothetical protein METHP_00352 [Methanoregula sp. SKADARSKE-2]